MMQQKQGGNQLEHDEQEKERDVEVREDRAAVIDEVTTYYTPKQTVQRYNRVAEQYKNLRKTVDAYQEKIEETLESFPEEMDVLHLLISDQPQEEVGDTEITPNMLSNQSLQRYHNIQEMKEQIDDIKDKVQTSLEDAEDLYPAARKLADKHGYELEDKPDELREWKPEDDQPADEDEGSDEE